MIKLAHIALMFSALILTWNVIKYTISVWIDSSNATEHGDDLAAWLSIIACACWASLYTLSL